MFGAWLQGAIRAGRVFASAALLSACASAIQNDPINQRLTANLREVDAELATGVDTNYDDMVVALSFSGGGMRAAAFSYGVLEGFEQTRFGRYLAGSSRDAPPHPGNLVGPPQDAAIGQG